MSVNGEKTTQRDIDRLVSFWRDTLAQNGYLMAPSTVALVKETVEALKLVPVK